MRMEIGEVLRVPKLRKYFKKLTAHVRRQHGKVVIAEQVRVS